MYRLFLAGRYTLARPVSYLAMVAIGLAVMGLIVVASIMNGFLAETESFVRGTTADIVVLPLQHDQPFPREIVRKVIQAHADVVATSARLVRPAVFKVHGSPSLVRSSSKDADITHVLVHGIDSTEELANTRFGEYLDGVQRPEFAVENRADPFWISHQLVRRKLRNGDLPRVLMSESLLGYLGLGRGDGIDLVTLPDVVNLDDASVKPTTQTFVISGAFNSGHHDHDSTNIYIDRDLFSTWAGTPQEVSEFYVTAREGLGEGGLDRIKGQLGAMLRVSGFDSIVETWRDRHAIFLGAVENERNILFVIFLFFLLLVCTITFSVLTMMVQQKVRDIGILSAMGAPAGGVGSVFGMVGVCIASVGGALGLGSGILLAANINAVKDGIEWLFEIQIFRKEVYAFTEIPVSIDNGLNVGIAVTTVIGAVLICLVPAFRAARLDPVEALRHE